MRLNNPGAWLNTTPRRLLATLLVLLLVGVIAELTITKASGNLSATAANTGNTYTASSCFLPAGVSITNNIFTQSAVTIKAGCSIKWTNNGSNTHTTTSTSGVVLWDSGNMNTNATYTRQFNTVGSFPYRCDIHKGAMTGTITVN